MKDSRNERVRLSSIDDLGVAPMKNEGERYFDNLMDQEAYLRSVSTPYLPEEYSVSKPKTEVTPMTTINYPETNLTEEFFEDNLKIPDQLRFRDETLVKAVAALEAKADSDEPRIIGAQQASIRKASEELKVALERETKKNLKLSPFEKKLEEIAWELEILESEASGLKHMIQTAKEQVRTLLNSSINATIKSTPI